MRGPRFGGPERVARWLAECERALSAGPPQAGWLIGRAGLLALSGDVRGGWKDIEAAFAADPRLMALYAEGEFSQSPPKGKPSRLPRGRPEDVPSAAVLAVLDGGFKESLAWRGLLHRRALRYDEAAQDLSRAWALGLRSAALRTLVGEAKLQTGDASGLADLERALELPDARAWNHAWCGRAKVAFGRDARALAHLDRAIALDPDNGWTYAWRAEAKRLLRSPGGPLADFDRALSLLKSDAHRCFCRTWRGMALAEAGDAAAALADFDAVLASMPSYGPALQGRAAALRRLGRLDDWFEAFDCAARSDPKYLAVFCSSTPARLAESERDFGAVGARGWRGLARLLQGKSEAALADLDAALKSRRGDALLYAWRAQARQQLGRAEAALADFDRALALDPKSALTYAARAKLRLQLGQAPRALADLDRAVKLDDRQAAFLADRGCVKLLLDDAPGAVADLEQVVLRDARYARVYADLSAAHDRVGAREKAAACREKALALDAAQARARLKTWEDHWR